MHKVAILGAGKIGKTVATLLSQSNSYELTLADGLVQAAQAVAKELEHCQALAMDLDSEDSMAFIFEEKGAVVSCLPFNCNLRVAELALKYDCHYLDLTEDVSVTKKIRELAKQGQRSFIPQCGLAPGFITIAACHLLNKFDTIDGLNLRVGALPLYPGNMLQYNLTWSTDGLINEYGNLCEVIHNGQRQEVLPLEGLEQIMIGGVAYEAFNTSGGLGSLCETLEGTIRTLDYKSLRYPGHNKLIRFLMNDLRLNNDRETLKRLFEKALPITSQDIVVIYVSATGYQSSRFVEHCYVHTITHQTIAGHKWTGIQLTTAASICAVLDLLLVDKAIPQSGFIKQEEIDYELFIKNRFGRYYAQ